MVVIIWYQVVGFKTTHTCAFESYSCEVYSIQHDHVIKFVSDLRQVGYFLQVLRFPPSI